MLRLRRLGEGDLAGVDPLLMAAYGSPKSFVPRLRRLLAIEPEGWLLAEEGGRPLGTGGIVVFGATAYVGLVATEPSAQGRGVATSVMRRLLSLAGARGCQRLLLDASAAGRPLYERLGFVADDGIGHWLRPSLAEAEPPRYPAVEARIDGLGLRSLAEEGWSAGEVSRLGGADSGSPLPPELLEFDGDCWGERRDRALAVFAAEEPFHLFLARDSGSRLRGYGLFQAEAGVLGPLVASDAAAAALLLSGLLGLGGQGELGAYLPAANLEGARLLEAAGFTLQKSLTHMRLGPPLDPRRRRLVYSQANFALG